MNQNEHIYHLVRANILKAVKESFFVDSPTHVVRKIDRFYCLNHLLDSDIFLSRLADVLDEMRREYYYDIGEYDRIRTAIDGIKKFLDEKSAA